MTVARRRLLQSLTAAGVVRPAAAQSSEPGIEDLRAIGTLRGAPLSDGRLRILQPVIARRLVQLRALREVEIDDMVAPVTGIVVR